MYKDKEKQKEAQKRWIAEKRAKLQKKDVQDGSGSTNSIEPEPNIPLVEPNLSNSECRTLPENYGLENCTCQHCQQNRRSSNKLIINHGAYKKAADLGPFEVNRQILPGDIDYVGVSV